MNKYRNKPVWLNRKTLESWSLLAPPSNTVDSNHRDWSRFASVLEATVYREIRTYFQEEWVALQPKLTLKEKSRYSSAVHYVSDFLIKEPSKPLEVFTRWTLDEEIYKFVEAKGLMLPSAKLKFQLMEESLPNQRANLWIVSQQSSRYFGNNYPASISLCELAVELAKLKKTFSIQSKLRNPQQP